MTSDRNDGYEKRSVVFKPRSFSHLKELISYMIGAIMLGYKGVSLVELNVFFDLCRSKKSKLI